MTRVYETFVVKTSYWRPGDNYSKQIVDSIRRTIQDGDIVTLSEKAISTALGNILDENPVPARRLARVIAKYWMRYVWGYILGQLCHLKKKTIWRCRTYPTEEGAKHKQVALNRAGLFQALMFGSEGAIDGSNLPYSYVSLPLNDAQHIAQEICKTVKTELSKQVTVMIVDTDKTYSLGNFHFTSRPKSIREIHSGGGLLAYVIGRFFKLKRRATPIALSGSALEVEEALKIAEIANKLRGFGAGRTVWDMVATFDVSLSSVTWDMLNLVHHKPIVIFRP